MDYIQLRKRNVISKYHDSDIFNLKNETKLNKSSNPSRMRTYQPSLEKTKDDIFNTLQENKVKKIKPLQKRTYIQNYLNTDIFNTHLDNSVKKSRQNKRININASSCFNGLLNNEEYKKELNDYTNEHRSKKKEYDADKYFNKISAVGRYYTEMYGDEKSGIFPKSKNILSKTKNNSPNKIGMNSVFKNNLRNFEVRKRNLKIEVNRNNTEYSVDGTKKINKIKDIDNKGQFNKKKIDIYGENLDSKNNKSVIKEKNGIEYNSKLLKQLENQSNIFGEENKDIYTKMDDYIKNKKEEKENKLKLKEKIEKEKEKEELNSKINGQNKKNLCLNKNIWGGIHSKWQKSNMDWTDPGAQILFKKNNTEANLNKDKTEITAFQRKLKDLADSDNIDTLSERKRDSNVDKLRTKKSNINEDDNNIEQTKEILNSMPNNVLREDQKIMAINNSTTSQFLNSTTNENLSQMLNRINVNIKNERLNKNRKKDTNIIKIMGKNSHMNDKNNNNNNIDNKIITNDYYLIYPTKSSSNKLDNLNPTEIKNIFGEKGIHIFDVKKDELGVGKFNKIKFKIRENTENNINDLEQKIKLVEEDLNKNKYKVSIKKDENINHKKKIKNNNENPLKDANNKIIANRYKKRDFLGQFPTVDLKYKNLNLKK